MNRFTTLANVRITTDFLKRLGFDNDAIKLYTTLVQKGPLTLLEISRVSGIERTKLYRMIDNLLDKKLIEEIPQHKRKVIKAVDIQTIELLIKEKELEYQYLNTSLPIFSDALKSLTNSIPANNVIYYRGTEGIKQMTWNILHCKGLFRTYSYRFWDDILSSKIVQELNKEMIKKKFKVHDLYSDQYIEFKKQWMAEKRGKPKGNWEFWESRYIPEKNLTINQNIDIYNNVVSYYYWQGEETFGVEIYNERVANLQKQIHDILWKTAKHRPDLDWSEEWE